jgi:pimeloyl-ACP methyl ester carboxylesterase
MRTERIPVADGVELAVDLWGPADDPTPGDDVAPGDEVAPTGDPVGGVPPGRPAFVLVHGLASNARTWDGVAERLAAAGHPVATVDLRGHGRSSKPDGPYDVATVADDVAALLGGLGFDHPVVAGQSWGGNVVVELAARHPGLIRGIVCVDGGWLEPSRDFESWEACRAALAPPRLAGRRLTEIERYIRTAHPAWPESGILGTLANFEVRADGTIAPWLTFDRHIVVLRGIWDHHPSARYPELTTPVLLVPAGGGDPDWTARKRRSITAALAAIPNARAHWIEGDHDIHAQRPAELAGVMHEMTTNGFFA